MCIGQPSKAQTGKLPHSSWGRLSSLLREGISASGCVSEMVRLKKTHELHLQGCDFGDICSVELFPHDPREWPAALGALLVMLKDPASPLRAPGSTGHADGCSLPPHLALFGACTCERVRPDTVRKPSSRSVLSCPATEHVTLTALCLKGRFAGWCSQGL
jgi:hypothetical protein